VGSSAIGRRGNPPSVSEGCDDNAGLLKKKPDHVIVTGLDLKRNTTYLARKSKAAWDTKKLRTRKKDTFTHNISYIAQPVNIKCDSVNKKTQDQHYYQHSSLSIPTLDAETPLRQSIMLDRTPELCQDVRICDYALP
jgi:hypothetical protein